MHLRNLVKIRKGRAWSQKQLAREANISYNTLVKIERRVVENPRMETVTKLAKALKVSIGTLIGRNISEVYFEEYLDARHIEWDYEPFEGTKPDYLLHLTGGDVICEVKEIDDNKDIRKDHVFCRQVTNEMEKLNLPFSVSCRRSQNCTTKHLRRFCAFIDRYRDHIIKEMRRGDSAMLGEDFIVGKGKLVVIKDQGKNDRRCFTLETNSGKYPLKRRHGEYGIHERCLLTSDGTSKVHEMIRISSYGDPLIQMERIDVEGNLVMQLLRGFAIDKVTQIRSAINRARRQIRSHKSKRLPFVLVLFSTGSFDIDEKDLLQAMFGKLTMTLYVSSDPTIFTQRRDPYHGKQAMIKGKNTSFSAMSLLSKKGNSSFGLFTAHNPYAKNRLGFDIFNDTVDKQVYVDMRSGKLREYK